MTTGVTQWKIGEEKPGHAAIFHNIAGRPNHHRRNTMGFKMPCDQTHGLVAHGSKRAQKGGVGPVLTQVCEDPGRIFFNGLALAIFRGHAVKACR